MPEHRIRFRGGWDLEPGDGRQGSARFTLPTNWPTDRDGIVRLARRFGRPRSRVIEETFVLEFRQVPGLCLVELNGESLQLPAIDSGQLSIPLDSRLLDRNLLRIEADLRMVARSDLAEGWGDIALVILGEGEPS